MNKFWQVVSKKDLIFGIIVLILALIISFKPSNKVRFSFGEDAVDIKTTKYSMNIPYDMIDSVALTDKPDMGKKAGGFTDDIVATGLWQNEAWGEYTACIEVATDNCIVINLTDGRIFVVSRRDNEETQKIFDQFQLYVN